RVRIISGCRVLNHHSEKWPTRFAGDQVVCTVRALDRETVRDQCTDISFPIGEELYERFQVASLGPAHVADRIVAPFLLVCCVITARTVGTRNAEVKFLLVVRLSLDVHSDRSYSNDDGAVTRYGTRQIDRVAAGRFSGDQNTVNASATRCL